MEKLQKYFIRVRKLLDFTFFRILFFIVLGAILFAAMYSQVKPEKLDLGLFSVAEKTIRSPGTVEDKKSTEKKRKEARDQVQPVYTLKNEYTQNRVDLITSIFSAAAEVNDEIKEEMKKQEEPATVEKPANEEPSVSEKVTRLKAKLTSGVSKDLPGQVFSSLVQASNDELSIAKDLTVTAINNVMTKRIPGDEVENAKKRVEEELKYASLNESLRTAAIALGRYAVIQNEFYDPAATEDLRLQAAENVEHVKILQGQIIVEEGKLINQDIYHQLKLVGLLNTEKSFKPLIGLVVLITIILSAVFYYFYQMKSLPEKRQMFLLLYGIIFLLSILIMKLVSLLQIFNYAGIGYLFPAAMGGMLIKILIDEKLAILTAIILAVCGSVLFNEGVTGTLNFSEGIYILFSALAGILFLSGQNHRSKILQAGSIASLVNLLAIVALMFLPNGQFSGIEYGYYLLTALVSGIGSAVLTIGLLPFLEASFGILSTMRLIELSNPNHPLLRKILMEAPGTYHHSVMVANLAESACEAIGANGLLARVGSYYHDIGKTKRPNFFIENQMHHDNPHDRLPPDKSSHIIIAHVIDGSSILKKYHMPKEIIDIAEQHHGTTLLKFFYHKALQNDEETKESDFRYQGPKAQTKESAVVGIADSVEAAVRSLSQPTPELIESLVNKIVADRLQDGQLNECDITIKEIETVTHTLCETLKGIFHSRIEYPEMTKKKVKQA
ncbi:HD family phosphohydrolase [Neobacillus vireti]|uniref:Membrane associate hydrolase n=1 Tax=Neobacillus vireti LMG 21834 TaxID=1131730 RepID=A0AB94IIW7_9BACI|nr:HD family phosphohydrolase [Neobacillus vireti]ETI67001.1 putative membrane associate hydrolase [Neobacillus vireti LMG 21834]KLT16954.1 membrane protein [Neobacillus vireti]